MRGMTKLHRLQVGPSSDHPSPAHRLFLGPLTSWVDLYVTGCVVKAENTETSVEIVAPEIEKAPVAEAASVEAVEVNPQSP